MVYRVADYFFLFASLFASPGAIWLAPPVRGVDPSSILLPGAKVDAPLGGSGVVLCVMWPGLEAETPLPPAWASCVAIVAATSAAAQIASFFRVMISPF